MARITQSQVETWISTQTTGEFHYTKVLDGQVSPKLYHYLRNIMLRCREKGIAYPISNKDGWWRAGDNTLEELHWWDSNGVEDNHLILPLGINKYCVVPKASLVVVAGKYNAGKGLRHGTPVLTSVGWKPIEDMRIGDVVYTPRGHSTWVIGVFPQGQRRCYRFTFNDGSSIDSDEEHNWEIMTFTNRIYPKTGHGNINKNYNTWSTKTTREIVRICGVGRLIPRHKIVFPTTKPIGLPYKPVILDPYILGLLLGDGCFRQTSTTITTNQEETLNALRQAGLDIAKVKYSKYDYRIKKITWVIKRLGLCGKRSYEKFIPSDYLFNSIEVRLAILQGLLDTDATIDKTGKHIEFTSSSPQLAEDVMFLVRSLGGRASLHTSSSAYLLNGHHVECRLRHRVSIKFDDIKPFRLRHKLERCAIHKKTLNRVLYRIDDIGIDKTTCIKVLDTDGLFIAKDFIVTHNTCFCLNTVALNVPEWQGHLDLYVSEGMEKLKQKFTALGVEGIPAFKTYHRTQNFADVIQPDNLSIIDWLRVDMTQAYAVSEKLFEIYNKLTTGIAVVAMQKPPGERKLAFGGAATAFEPALYIAMESNGAHTGWVGFEKIKIPTGYGGWDWSAMKVYYRIEQGVTFCDIEEKRQ